MKENVVRKTGKVLSTRKTIQCELILLFQAKTGKKSIKNGIKVGITAMMVCECGGQGESVIRAGSRWGGDIRKVGVGIFVCSHIFHPIFLVLPALSLLPPI